MMDYQMLRLNLPYTGDKIAIAPLLSLISFLTLALIVWSYTIFPKGNNLILGLYVCILFFFFFGMRKDRHHLAQGDQIYFKKKKKKKSLKTSDSTGLLIMGSS